MLKTILFDERVSMYKSMKMKNHFLPGRYFWRNARLGGIDVLYKSFNKNILIYRCWTSDQISAEQMVDDLNARLFSEFVAGEVKIEKDIEKTQKMIERNRLSRR